MELNKFKLEREIVNTIMSLENNKEIIKKILIDFIRETENSEDILDIFYKISKEILFKKEKEIRNKQTALKLFVLATELKIPQDSQEYINAITPAIRELKSDSNLSETEKIFINKYKNFL